MLVRRHVSREENDVVPTEREREREIPSLLLFYFRFVHSFRSVSFRLVWLVRDGFEREETDGTRSRGGGVKGVVSMM